jgi:WD40 repeat protein
MDGGGLLNRIRVCDRGVQSVAFSPDGRAIATGDEEGKIRLWNAANGMPQAFSGSQERAVTALAWASDGKTLVSGGADGTLHYWNVTTGAELAKIAAHDGAVRALLAP